MIVLVPSNRALDRLIPDLNPAMPNPLLTDVALMNQIVQSHIMTREGRIPKIIFDNLPEYQEIIKVNLRGDNVVFHREDDIDTEKSTKYFSFLKHFNIFDRSSI